MLECIHACGSKHRKVLLPVRSDEFSSRLSRETPASQLGKRTAHNRDDNRISSNMPQRSKLLAPIVKKHGATSSTWARAQEFLPSSTERTCGKRLSHSEKDMSKGDSTTSLHSPCGRCGKMQDVARNPVSRNRTSTLRSWTAPRHQ